MRAGRTPENDGRSCEGHVTEGWILGVVDFIFLTQAGMKFQLLVVNWHDILQLTLS